MIGFKDDGQDQYKWEISSNVEQGHIYQNSYVLIVRLMIIVSLLEFNCLYVIWILLKKGELKCLNIFDH